MHTRTKQIIDTLTSIDGLKSDGEYVDIIDGLYDAWSMDPEFIQNVVSLWFHGDTTTEPPIMESSWDELYKRFQQ